MKRFRAFIAVMMTLFALVSPLRGSAEENQTKDLSNIIEKVEMISGTTDQFGKETMKFDSAKLKIDLKYDETTNEPKIIKGDTLKIKLVPNDYSKNFIYMDYETSTKNELIDSSKKPPAKVADIDLTGRDGVELTFTGGVEIFAAHFDLPFVIRKTEITDYFTAHPDEESVTFTYQLQINGKPVDGKTLSYTIDKPSPQSATQQFYKTRGIYKQKGKLGDGNFLFNIVIDTELRSPNEYVIYDVPDINLGFDGYLKVCDAASTGAMDRDIFANSNTDPNGAYISSATDDNGTTVKAYDVYYVTKDPVDDKAIRIAAWEEKKLVFQRADVEGGSLTSMDQATVPKNILFEKPLGTPLTEEEKQTIDANGGLYNKVGKGFKVTISDYKSRYLDKGGHLTFIYRMNIKNPSTKLDKEGNPVYKNFATYYAQEIPNCKPEDENCTPIKAEKTKEKDSGHPERPTEGIVKPGTIGADVTIPEVQFTKVWEDGSKNPLETKPLKGATFTIYKSTDGNTKGEVATNKEGIALENLITNNEGKLTKDNTVVALNLDKGYYIFSETKAPEGYEIINKDTPVTIGYKETKVIIKNKNKNTNPTTETKYKVTYEFKAENEDDHLPESVMNLLPKDTEGYENGATVNAISPTTKEVKTESGKWKFMGYDKENATIDKADIKFVGVWKFEKNDKPIDPGKTEDPPKPIDPKPQEPSKPIVPSKPVDSSTLTKTGTTNNLAQNNKTQMYKSIPRTGDDSHALRYLVLLAVTAVLLVIIIRKSHKKR